MNKTHVTIIDDNLDFLEAMSHILGESFQLSTFHDPQRALEFIGTNHTDAILLDLNIPKACGFHICREVKKTRANLPVLFLTGDLDIKNIVKGFEVGGDDYLDKTVHPDEIIARVKTRVHLSGQLPNDSQKLKFKDVTIDLEGHQVLLKDEYLKLTPKEYDLLLILAQNVNKVILKSDIMKGLWPDVHVEVNNLDTHFSNLRRKLKPFSNNIKTIKNMGYVLRLPAP